MNPPLVIASQLPGAGGGVAAAASVAVVLAATDSRRGALLIEIGAERGRGPTMLASEGARRLEGSLREVGLTAAARGRLCWLCLPADADPLARMELALGIAADARAAVAHVPTKLWWPLLGSPDVNVVGGLIRAELPRQRSLASLAVRELREAGAQARVVTRAPGPVAARRAAAGLDPGGQAAHRAARLARGLLGAAARPERGQALPLVLGAAFVLLVCALVLAALGGAVTGVQRAQRLADLTALSAARSMRDDFSRLFVAPRMPDGRPNPRHLSREAYLARAATAARDAASRNEADPGRLRVEFPDRRSFAPLRVRVRVVGALEGRHLDVAASAEAMASAPAASPAPSPVASGGGYSGPLAYRQGKPMRPDVAVAFERLAAEARRAGLALVITSGYRSDAEQAALFAQNPDPRWVAPPGRSLHRCATELDLGPAAAYGWLAANASRFGFLRRYSWEPWHFGYTRGPAPCSASASRGLGTNSSEGRSAGAGGLPAYVPARFRGALARSASRWNVSAALLAAQLMAESNFNPFAVSPAGARGIAQFMPGTAAAYGLGDPFDAAASIDAQAHLMSDLLSEFGSPPLALAAYNAGPGPVAACECVPAYPETQAYVARILGLMGGVGELGPPALEVRLVA